MADDITTNAEAGCSLDRFDFLVSGDTQSDPSADLGPFAVTYGLYELCPSADSANQPIAETSGTINLPDDGIYEIAVQIPDDATIPVSNLLYLAVSFDRNGAGVYVGEPAEIGFSDDHFDFPGFACNATLGGYPTYPHASFNASVYLRQPCEHAFVAYRNNNAATTDFLAERPGLIAADDLRLDVQDCQMIAYELAIDAIANLPGISGTVKVHLHSALSDTDPTTANLIEGTSMTGMLRDVPLLRAVFDPPIPIPKDLWIVVEASYPSPGFYIIGPVITCRNASIGETAAEYQRYDGNAWQPTMAGPQCTTGFQVSITCAGAAPIPDGDMDADSNVDLADVALLQNCFVRGTHLNPGCVSSDFNGDVLIDLLDYAKFWSLITGP